MTSRQGRRRVSPKCMLTREHRHGELRVQLRELPRQILLRAAVGVGEQQVQRLSAAPAHNPWNRSISHISSRPLNANTLECCPRDSARPNLAPEGSSIPLVQNASCYHSKCISTRNLTCRVIF